MSKFDRRNQAKQARLSKHREHLKETSIFSGKDGAPRVVAVVPLCADGDAKNAVKQLNGSLDIDTEVQDGPFRVSVDRFKQKLQYIPLRRELNACLDAARVADFVVVILSANEEVDALGELILRSIESQGMSTLFTSVQGLDKVEPAKQRQSTVASLKSFITHFHPEQDKLYSLDSRQECSNLMRSLCNTTPKGVRWRDDRSWILAEDIKFAACESEPTVLTGVVRGRGLNADRLVQICDWGTYQIEKIVAAPLPRHAKRGEEMAVGDEADEVLEVPSEDRDDLHHLAPEDVVMAAEDDSEMTAAPAPKKGVLLDEHHYFSDDDAEERKIKKRVPKGTSSYQSAWYLDDVSDSGSDMEDMEMDDQKEEDEEIGAEDGVEGCAQAAEPTDPGPSEYPQSEMMDIPDDAEDAQQLAQYRARKRDEAEDDREFPDEIELHPHVLARERLARYRGLKSLRTSPWQEDEDRAHEPEEWRRLLQVPDYNSSRSRAVREALVGGVAPGTRVHVHIKGVAADVARSHEPGSPVTLFSLLRHENKTTSLNYLFSLSNDYGKSIKSKEELIVQCGPRRMAVKPIFSNPGSTPNDVHKFCRYVHPGQSVIASFMGPMTWGAVPVVFFKRCAPAPAGANGDEDIGLSLIGTGTALPPSTSRVVAKRAILTGHPYHIHKKMVTVRYMFFSREDVEWFKALPLWTRRGRTGFVKEPLGTHGYFKATFDGRINPQDAVGVSLYKRVWPRASKPVREPLLQGPAAAAAAAGAGAGAGAAGQGQNEDVTME
ncbi:Ribosome biogenesis protein BMS1/TSR1 [Metarhizium album ARSEF 1941]|uniref:Ribosome biogenesis protein BMS1/TSR1 n=1 Tax=Metarhizium album (strain ARSEF 1941) TaxID=1081103 RepID=A0A0B2WWH4_METAS|nr:Ribosome biogenesis protein BMS1/TSR1 [Metarhizium album ARSEF 1941]KHN97747.1 Ribosome biogenesis protein BMS1/TSR1 [Metarhizium album ARSEF 1941]